MTNASLAHRRSSSARASIAAARSALACCASCAIKSSSSAIFKFSKLSMLSFSALSAAADDSARDAAVSCSQLSRSSRAAVRSWFSSDLTSFRAPSSATRSRESDALTSSSLPASATRCFSTKKNLASAAALCCAICSVCSADFDTVALRAASAFPSCFSASRDAASTVPSARARESSLVLIRAKAATNSRCFMSTVSVSLAAAADFSATLDSNSCFSVSSCARDASASARKTLATCISVINRRFSASKFSFRDSTSPSRERAWFDFSTAASAAAALASD
mmetsp:Transcript_6661/g.25098  ORF Transcript_6661/g.25098 Transcript_6661/m.25098 type:complete len:280 (-) Transcript_6661:1589-2428(-)